jgi:type I restriction enzyme S subunit
MSNLVPEGWSENKIGEIASVFAGGTPSRSNPNYYVGSIPWVKSGEVNARQIYSTSEHISELAVKETSAKWAPAGSVLVAMYGATAGKVSRLMINATLNQAVSAINCHNGIASNDYLLQAIKFNCEELLNTVQGSGQPNLSGHLIKGLPLLFPPLPEQQKIAAILTSVDEVIEKTQAQIDKLKDLKTAMMQELLLPSENGGVGTKQGDAYIPHTEFKDSPVGRIPKSWDCCLLDNVAKRGSGHTPNKLKPEYWNDGVKWVSLTDSSKLDRLYINDSAKKISQLGIENSSATMHPVGTVVMARDAGIGKSAIMTSSMAVSQHFMAWVCGVRLNNYFLYYLLQLWKPKFEAIAMGSTIKTIGLPYFKKLQIPLPSIDEQQLIAASLKSVDEKIFTLQRKRTSLADTKKALMQDLLTGKVRVKVET